VFRYLSFVSRGVRNADALWVTTGGGDNVNNIVFDHVSSYYGGDECLSITTAAGNGAMTGLTIQWSLMASASKGAILGTYDGPSNATCAYSAFVDTNYRFPNMLALTSDSYQDAINNFVENYGSRLIRVTGGGDFLVRNMYIQPNRANYGLQQLQWRTATPAKLHSSGTIIVGKRDTPTTPDFDLWEIFAASDLPENDPIPEAAKVDTPRDLTGVPYEVMPTTDVPTRVLPFVGNSAHLDVDGSIVNEPYALDTFFLDLAINPVSTSDARRVPDPKYPTVPSRTTPASADTDKDGMPDVWEQATFGTLDRDGKGDEDGDGYTDLEEYLWLIDGGAGSPATNSGGGDGEGSTTSPSGSSTSAAGGSSTPASTTAPGTTTAAAGEDSASAADGSASPSSASDNAPLIVAIVAIGVLCLMMAGVASFFYSRSQRDRAIALSATSGGPPRRRSRPASTRFH
jgi:hypothetical protein